MGNNHLIIGLGGTGGKIIRALRKSIYEEFRTKEPLLRTRNGQGIVEDKPHPVKLGYLYVDSDESLMLRDEMSWRIPGDTLQIGVASQLLIRGANLLNVLEDPSGNPNVAPWIGPRDQWRDILGSIVGETLGGQKRRLGRFLFACKAGGIEGFVEKLDHQVQELRDKTDEKAVTFHICCGLAGGTGSGSFIDVISLIRKKYNEENDRIILYALLPDTHPPAKWDTGNYHANGFAGLIELNALSVGAFEPWDVCDGKDRIRFRDASGTPVSPVNGCYVFTNENERGKILNLDRDEVSQVVASFLFQKIIMVNSTTWAGALRKMENAENGDGSAETAPGTKIPERSKRFLTFGIKRLVIPEEEIREYLTYEFARQAALQLQYNNWSATQRGYLDSSVNEAFAQYVSDARSHERWTMSDSHLCLETGILPMELQDQWKPIEAEWNTVITNSAQVAMKGEPTTWMATLTRLCEEFYNLRWRGKGVVDFYKTKQGDQAAEASAIVRKLERELFDDWINGKRSMFDLGRILTELRRTLKEKRDFAERKVVEFGDMVKETKGANALLADIRKNNQTWADIGVLSGAFGKRERTIQAQAEVFKRFYAARHRIETWAYAGNLVDKVILEADALAATVATNISLLTELVEGESNQVVQNRFVGLKERIEARCKENESVDLNDQVIKFYKASQVKDFTTRLLGNEEIQRGQSSAVRKAMLEKLGETPTLAKFHQRLTRGVLLDLLETICGEEAEKAHNHMIAEDPRAHRILGNNIVDKLNRDFSGNPLELAHYISELVTRAGLYLSFDGEQEGKKDPDLGGSPCTRVTNYTVIIPKGQEHPQFRADIEEAFKHAYGTKVDFVEGTKANEITMVSIANLFPLRYAKHARFLESKYRSRIDSFGRAKLELHSEGEGKGYPPIFLVSGRDVEILPSLLLARAMKLIGELEDPDTGNKGLYLLTKDERGRDNDPVLLGASDEEIVEKRDVALANRLLSSIQQLLNSDYQHRAKRDEIGVALDKGLAGVAERIPNPLDKRRKAYKEAVTKAEEMLK